MISELEIYETFMEFWGIQSIDQCQGEYTGKQQAKAFTKDWLIERGFEKKTASMAIYKAIKKYEDTSC